MTVSAIFLTYVKYYTTEFITPISLHKNTVLVLLTFKCLAGGSSKNAITCGFTVNKLAENDKGGFTVQQGHTAIGRSTAN